MRKLLISIVVCFVLIGTALLMVQGSENLGINGFVELNKKNKEVEETINNLAIVINSDYNKQYTQLKKSASDLTEHKTEFENQYLLSQSAEQSYVNGREKYDIDYLWTILGNYAKDENVIIQIDVTKAGVSDTLYNLNFTVTGSYIGITNFIYDIENNSKLGFKIDDFLMAMSADKLYANFTCKGIPIKLGEIDTGSINPVDTENMKVTDNTSNTTNSTNITESNTNSTNNTSENTNSNTTTGNTTGYSSNTSGN